MTHDRPMPTAELYRGVRIFGLQPAERIESVVKPAIDRVYLIVDAQALVEYAADAGNSPEARLFAAARVEAIWQLAAEGRAVRPAVSLDYLRAATAGLDSRQWCDPRRYGALFDFRRSMSRETSLTEAQLRG